MFPWVNGFQWQAGHLIFLGLFFGVAIGIGTTLVAALARSRRALREERAEGIRWKAAFAGLPSSSRLCRSSLTGGLTHICTNAFDCGSCSRCPEHATGPAAVLTDDGEVVVNGLRYPMDRGYHRGHTWVRQESDGCVTVGLDEMAARMVGGAESAELPPAGTLLRANGRGFELRKNGSVFQILSPISGHVVARGGADKGWFLRLRPQKPGDCSRHLLRGCDELRAWVLREMERLQSQGRIGTVGVTLADGGEMVEDLSKTLPRAEWDHLCGEMLLDL